MPTDFFWPVDRCKADPRGASELINAQYRDIKSLVRDLDRLVRDLDSMETAYRVLRQTQMLPILCSACAKEVSRNMEPAVVSDRSDTDRTAETVGTGHQSRSNHNHSNQNHYGNSEHLD